MKENNRRNFIRTASIIGAGITMVGTTAFKEKIKGKKIEGKGKIGIVGMDTSHSPSFVKEINDANSGFKVTTAFTTVSLDMPPSADRVDKFTKQISDMGVEIVPTLDELLKKVDFVLLCTVDGRRHLEQAKQILKAGKRVFIDKPIAATLADAIKIFKLSKKYKLPVFTSSSIRYMNKTVQEIRNGSIGKILGADTYAPVAYEPTQPDLFWYGIHGIELLFTVMNTGCQRVRRLSTEQFDMVTGDWGDGRIGKYRGVKMKMWEYGGQAFGEKGVSYLGKYEKSATLTELILHYFNTGEIPVQPEETLEIFAFMEAASASKANDGKWVSIKETLDKAGYK